MTLAVGPSFHACSLNRGSSNSSNGVEEVSYLSGSSGELLVALHCLNASGKCLLICGRVLICLSTCGRVASLAKAVVNSPASMECMCSTQ